MDSKTWRDFFLMGVNSQHNMGEGWWIKEEHKKLRIKEEGD